jgi:hypothetical protein
MCTVYVPGFRDLLGRLDVPVLALFGEKDRNVDWRKTRARMSAGYYETLLDWLRTEVLEAP